METCVPTWNILVLCTGDPVFHFPLVEHAAAAVDDHVIVCHILRKFRAGSEGEGRGCAGVLSDPVWQLNGADVIALPVMGAALADKHPIPIF